MMMHFFQEDRGATEKMRTLTKMKHLHN